MSQEMDFAQEQAKQDVFNEICSLKAMLDSNASGVGDWKVVKCYEASLKGESMPYDLDELMEKRQEIRDKINQLQAQYEAM